MSYGKGNGFRTGIERKNYNDEIPLTAVYVKGDDRNIGQYVGANNQTQTYDGKTLHLPKSATGGYDGSHFSWEQGYSSTGALSFAVSADGYSVRDTGASGRNEGILDCTDIYPKYEGTVTKVDTVDASKNLYDFYDSAANCPNFANLATSETMTVIFQSGMLAGREFDVNCKGSTTDGIHFEIVPVEQDTLPMPGGTFVPAAGDKYIIFHCKLPYQYINDATNHAGAEWDMLKTAVKYLYEARNPRYSITGELDGNWSSSHWSTIREKIKCGGYLSFIDPSFQATPFLIRIQSVKHFVNKPYKPVITLANTPTKASVASQIRSIERDNFGNELQINDSRQFTKRTFASAKATMDALAEYFADYSDFIKPVGIQTMQMIAGDERLQLQFSDFSSFSSFKQAPVVWSSGLVCGTGYVRNVNIGDDREIITTISGGHGYHAWVINSNTLTTDALTHTALVDNKQYYLYLRAPKAISQTASQNYAQWELYPVGEDDSVLEFYDGTNYNFLVGILNMMEDETRQFVPIYGFTEITPGGITTDMIRSSQGNSWLNLLRGTFSWSNGYSPSSSSFKGMSWDGENFKIQGDVNITSGSGLNHFSEYSNLTDSISSKASTSDLHSLQSTLETQIDGKIDTYYDANDPSSAWTSAEDKAKHVGDLWFKKGDNNTVYRYQYLGSSSYGWISVRDGDIPKALATANSKKRVFYSTTANPTPLGPYDANDLWIRNGILYVCIRGNAELNGYSAEDWQQGLYFDVNDKAEVKREWQKIHGEPNVTGSPSDKGSYITTKNIVEGAGYGAEENVVLTYDGYVLTYGSNNTDILRYKASGTAAFDAAYNALKTYLTTYNLYDNQEEWASGYDPDEMTRLLTAYYTAQTEFLANAQFSVVSDLEYLKAALPQGASTDIAGGIVLSTILGVRDENNHVTAGMNGNVGDLNPMLWAGSSNASTINNAKWRVYRDGRMVLCDSSGGNFTVIDGNTYTLSDVFGADASKALTGGSATGSEPLVDGGGPFVVTISNNVQTNLDTDKDGTFAFPSITLSGRVERSDPGQRVTVNSAQITLKVDGQEVSSLSNSSVQVGSNFSDTITGVQMYLPAGTHTISVEGVFYGEHYGDDPTFTTNFTAGVTYGGSGTLIVNQKKAHLCSNGFILGKSNVDYMQATVDSNGMNFVARSGNAGVKVYNGALKLLLNGSWYTASEDGGYLKLTSTTE